MDDFAPSLDALKDRAEALYVCSDPLITTNRVRLITSALGVRLPTIHGFREFVEAGGLMSYGPNFLAAVSLQLGYFLAILMRLVSTRLSAETLNDGEPRGCLWTYAGAQQIVSCRRCTPNAPFARLEMLSAERP